MRPDVKAGTGMDVGTGFKCGNRSQMWRLSLGVEAEAGSGG